MFKKRRDKFNSFDVLGNIAIMKFSRGFKRKEKIQIAEKFLKKNKSVKSVFEKTKGFRGKLRRQKTKHLAGENTKEALYKENDCVFRFHIDKTYFSSRLSNERIEIAKKIRKGEKVFVMCAGVSPYPIVIAKKSKAKVVDSNEINKKANKYAELNINLNKMKGKVNLFPGNIKKVVKKLEEQNKKYDVIVMPRPQLKYSFIKEALTLSKKGTRIYYYGFCKYNEMGFLRADLEKEAKKEGRKIEAINLKKAGEIAPYKYRVRIDFKVL